MYACMHVCMSVGLYVCMYVCMYVCYVWLYLKKPAPNTIIRLVEMASAMRRLRKKHGVKLSKAWLEKFPRPDKDIGSGFGGFRISGSGS